jgi:hypothetical protein
VSGRNRGEQRLPSLPTDPRDRVVFCVAYGDKYDGDNHAEAMNFAEFSVIYNKGLKLGPYAEAGQ